jgi:hypothetical protein
MEDIIKKITLLINQEFMKNHFQYKNDLKKIDTKEEIILWINKNRHLFNIYFRQDLDNIISGLLNNNNPS